MRKRTSSLPGVVAQEGYSGPSAFQEVMPGSIGSSKRKIVTMPHNQNDWMVQTNIISSVSGTPLGKSHHPPNVTYVKVVSPRLVVGRTPAEKRLSRY